MTLDKAAQVGERADELLTVIHDSDLPTEGQVTLLMQIYTLLLRLQLGQLIIQLETLQENRYRRMNTYLFPLRQ